MSLKDSEVMHLFYKNVQPVLLNVDVLQVVKDHVQKHRQLVIITMNANV